MNSSSKTDIRLVKYEDYVRKHPKKAYGYYCLGKIHMMLCNYKTAEEHFQKALLLDKGHTLSIVGLIEAYVLRRKLLKAVNLFSRHREDINRKYIYRVRLVRTVSSALKKSNMFSGKSGGLISDLVMKYTIYYAKGMVKKEANNIVLKLILAIYYLKSDERNPFIHQLFKTCVYWDGLEDSLRWELLKNLDRSGENLFYDISIARKFSSIPDTGCSSEYASIIFGTSLIEGKRTKVTGVYNSAGKFDIKLSPNMMWSYVNWSMENSFYDNSVYDCCRKLIRTGWIDRLIAETMIKLRDKNAVKFSNEDERVLRLYGYLG
ncbi:MAG: tetratricopeptide repeat protein [Clostridiaceae bacterium]|nr:tetratricopeptide repeat protein [Clostridiaceae bacterium]